MVKETAPRWPYSENLIDFHNELEQVAPAGLNAITKCARKHISRTDRMAKKFYKFIIPETAEMIERQINSGVITDIEVSEISPLLQEAFKGLVKKNYVCDCLKDPKYKNQSRRGNALKRWHSWNLGDLAQKTVRNSAASTSSDCGFMTSSGIEYTLLPSGATAIGNPPSAHSGSLSIHADAIWLISAANSLSGSALSIHTIRGEPRIASNTEQLLTISGDSQHLTCHVIISSENDSKSVRTIERLTSGCTVMRCSGSINFVLASKGLDRSTGYLG